MKFRFRLFLLCLFIVSWTAANAQNKTSYLYDVPPNPWEEAFGNHRAVLKIDKPSDVAMLDFLWRRGDKKVDQRRLVIVEASTGDTIPNILREEVNNERCRLKFGPVKEKGLYYFYYLPYKVQLGGGSYWGDYISPESKPQEEWLNRIKNNKNAIHAKIVKVQSRTAFDSFYPMELPATSKEQANYRKNSGEGFYLFPEDRKFPIRMRDNIPYKWLEMKQGKEFYGEALKNEYYAFQIGLWAPNVNVTNVTYMASELKCGSHVLPANAITCFNTEGVDPYGKPFKKTIDVPKGGVQPLWFGVDIPTDAMPGEYNGTITVSGNNSIKKVVPIRIKISAQVLADRGDSEPWRHSRLRWLNSTLGIEDTPTRPYIAMSLEGNRIGCLGRQVLVDESTGLPAQIDSWGCKILNAPMMFVVETDKGVKTLNAIPNLDSFTAGHVSGSLQAEDADLIISTKAVMEYDGWMNYIYTVTPKKEIHIKDIRLQMAIKNEVASYFLGAGLPGQDTPQQYEGKWDAPERTVNNFGVSIPTNKSQQWLWPFDSFWIGNTQAGIHCELRGTTYSGPLLNAYRPAYPDSWNNKGKGGFKVERGQESTSVVVYSGERTLKVGSPIVFDFALIITPVKPLQTKPQFVDRYYHNGSKPVPTDADVKAGVRIINIHHANEYNPFINYPFLTVDKMKAFTSEWHKKGCKVKLYYTLRELTSAVTEIWAIRSLDTEILRGGNGGGFPWCREHLIGNYTPQWYQHFDHMDETGIAADAALLTTESNSRWYNYYVEGLRWMVKNMDIDGIYLDDVSFDRQILKRMRRAMDSVKPGCLIDLHSNTGFSRGPANQYTEFFPYVDKLWFGESFLYDRMSPANWLVESSGIPFGLMGDMLHRGGNAWLGMQYGMTVRYPWYTEGVNCDPKAIWKIWDDFGIDHAIMHGFWEKNPLATASDHAVKVTVYKNGNKVLLSIGNYSDEDKTVHLQIDWKRLGVDPAHVKLVAPTIQNFQNEGEWKSTDAIAVAPRKGWLIYVLPQ